MRAGWKYEVAYLNTKGELIHIASGCDNVELEDMAKEIGYYFVLYEHSHRVVAYHYNGYALKNVRQPKFVASKIKEWKEAVFG